MDTTIDELRAGWERVREQVKQLTEENQRLQRECSIRASMLSKVSDACYTKDELLWWVTALACRDYETTKVAARAKAKTTLAEMLATQGYTRENLQKR